MKYYGGCDVGSTYTKAVILDETGKICADTTIRSKINSETSAKLAMEEVLNKVGLKSSQDLAYLIGTGYGRNKVPFADENISEISCHAMGVHVTDPGVKAIIDIGGQDVKGISIDTDGTVKNFAMNDKCAAGTGRFYEAMARSFEMSLPEFSNLSLTAKNVIPITAQCTVFAESEVITLVGEGKPMDEIAAGIQMAVAKRCFVMAKKAGATDAITLTGGCAKNAGLKQAIERVLKLKVIDLKTDPQLMGALGAAEYARQKGMARWPYPDHGRSEPSVPGPGAPGVCAQNGGAGRGLRRGAGAAGGGDLRPEQHRPGHPQGPHCPLHCGRCGVRRQRGRGFPEPGH